MSGSGVQNEVAEGFPPSMSVPLPGLRAGYWSYRLATFLPMILLIVVAVGFVSSYQRDALEQRLRNSVASLSVEIGKELAFRVNLLEVLSLSRALAEDDLAAFHDHMRRFVSLKEHDWLRVALVDAASERILAESGQPFGKSLRYSGASDLVHRIVSGRRHYIYGVVPSGELAQEPMIAMGIPIIRGGAVKYVLKGIFPPQAFEHSLRRRISGLDGVAALVDGNLNISGRSHSTEQFVGQPAISSLAEKIRNGESGFFTALTKDGRSMAVIAAPIHQSDWTAVVGVSLEDFEAPIRRTRLMFILAASLVGAMTVGGAALLARAERRRLRLEEEFAAAKAESERREKEALMMAKIEAETANRTKSEFLAHVSHELRTPLNAIIGFSEIMTEFPDSSGNHVEYARNIHESGRHLLEVINDILDISVIEAGKLELNEEFIDPEEVIASSIRMFERKAWQNGIDLEYQALPDLPRLLADRRRVKQILINLISNAVKYTSNGGKVKVTARTLKEGGMEFSVSDTGIGMDSQGIVMALSPFGHADNEPYRNYDGAGLGLTLALGMIKAHGGDLAVESQPGKGTKVSVTFPKERVIPPAR